MILHAALIASIWDATVVLCTLISSDTSLMNSCMLGLWIDSLIKSSFQMYNMELLMVVNSFTMAKRVLFILLISPVHLSIYVRLFILFQSFWVPSSIVLPKSLSYSLMIVFFSKELNDLWISFYSLSIYLSPLISSYYLYSFNTKFWIFLDNSMPSESIYLASFMNSSTSSIISTKNLRLVWSRFLSLPVNSFFVSLMIFLVDRFLSTSRPWSFQSFSTSPI